MDRNSPTREIEDAVEEFFRRGVYPSLDDFLGRFIDELETRCVATCGRMVCDSIGIAVATAAGELYQLAGLSGQLTRLTDLDAVGHGRYRDHLLAILHLDDDHANRVTAFIRTLLTCFDPLLRALPPPAFTSADTERS